MARSANSKLKRITAVTAAWQTLRPNKTFSGMTLDQYKEAIKPSFDIREEIEELDSRLQAAIARREAADAASLKVGKRVVSAVVSDAEEGPDGELYAAMGYVRDSARNSGLTRRRNGEEVKTENTA